VSYSPPYLFSGLSSFSLACFGAESISAHNHEKRGYCEVYKQFNSKHYSEKSLPLFEDRTFWLTFWFQGFFLWKAIKVYSVIIFRI
jgi:hypothetical protein